MQTIKHDGKEYKAQISNFRGCHAPGFEKLLGCHGKDQAECKACVLFTIAAIVVGDTVFTGLAKRSKLDQFNTKTGRSIAIGRALKSMTDSSVKHTLKVEPTQKFVDLLKKLRVIESQEQIVPEVVGVLETTVNGLYNVQPKRS